MVNDRCVIIVNPRAGNGGGEDVIRELRNSSCSWPIVITERRGHATELAKDAVLAGYEIIFAGGGDGTIHEVANGLISAQETVGDHGFVRKPRIGLLPCGSGNDFFTSLGVGGLQRRTGVASIRNALADDRTRLVDLIRLEFPDQTIHGVNVFSFGRISGEAVRIIAQRKIRTRGMYTRIGARLAWSASPMQIKGSYDGSALEVYVTNGSEVAGGIPIAPGASMSDGRLELLVVPDKNRVSRYVLLALARLGWIRSGLVTKLFGVTATWIDSNVTFKALTPVSAQVDGEPLEKPMRLVRVGVEAEKLGVLLPS